MSTDPGDDEILDRLNDEASVLPIRPAQPPEAPASSSSPSGPASQPSAWTITIPRPRLKLPSLRTTVEVLAVLLLIGWFASTHLTAPLPVPIVHHETGPLIAELIYDPEADDLAVGRLKADSTIKTKLAAVDCKWGWLESSEDMAKTLLKGQPVPAVAIARKGETEALRVLPIPPNGDPIVAVVKQLRGKD